MDAKLDPNWVTGFIEVDGSFIIQLKDTNMKLIPEGKGLSASAVISIGLDIRPYP